MSQKKETKILVFALVITLGLVGAGVWWIANRLGINPTEISTTQTNEKNYSVQQQLSGGEKLLITAEATAAKRAGAAAIASSNYQQAIGHLETALAANGNDPEARIYLHNARIGDGKSYAIAVSVPIGVDVNAAKELLRGVAQAQEEINQAGGIGGVPLKVIIANDDNSSELAPKVAMAFVEKPEILGAIGHFGSEVTLAAAPVYEKGKLVMISATSTSVRLSRAGSYIFRTVPSDRFAASALSRYMLRDLQQRKVAVFFNSESDYSKSLKDEFTTALFADGGEVIAEFDFANSDYSANHSVQQALARGAEVLMLAPNGATLNQALDVVAINRQRLLMLAGDSAYKPKTLQVGSKNAVGMVLAVPWHILASENSQFKRLSLQLWGGGEVNWRTALAYDAAKALIAAIERDPTRTGVQAALSASDFAAMGASGQIRFMPSGDRNQAVQLVEIQPGNRTSFGYEFVPISR